MYEGKRIIALIPARAGSKGVVNKNSRLFLGRPLIEWSVLAALNSRYLDSIYISSNCKIVKSLYDSWRHQKLGWISRPDSMCGEASSTEEAMLHAVDAVDQFDYIVLLQPTSPIRYRGMIDQVIEALLRSNRESLMTVSQHTPFFAQDLENQRVKWFYDPASRPMRGELSEIDFFLHDDGNIYITSVDWLLQSHCRVDSLPVLFRNYPYCSLQVDTVTDFRILEVVMKELGVHKEYENEAQTM